jgi:hypothetical protein
MEQIVRIDQLVIGKSYLEISANDADEDTLISSPDISDRFLLLGEPYDHKFTYSGTAKFFKAIMLQSGREMNLSVNDCGIVSDGEPSYYNNHRTFSCTDEEWEEVKDMSIEDFFVKYKI